MNGLKYNFFYSSICFLQVPNFKELFLFNLFKVTGSANKRKKKEMYLLVQIATGGCHRLTALPNFVMNALNLVNN